MTSDKTATLNALRLNVKLDAEQEMFYLRVHWQVERERERAIKRGLELDEQLRELKEQVSNVELTGSRAGSSPVSPATEGSEVERRVGGQADASAP